MGRDTTLQDGATAGVPDLIDRIAEGFATLRMIGDPPRDFVWINCNPAFAAMVGRPQSEIVGSKGSEIASGDLPRLVGQFAAVAHSGAPARFEYRYGTPERVWAVHAFSLGDGTLGVLHTDVTVERQAQAALHESEDHYRHAVELNPQVAWTSAPDGLLDYVGSRWTEWTGTPGTGEGWANGLHSDDREATFAAWHESIATGRPYDISHRVKMIDGSYRWARSRALARRDTAGAIVKWYGTTEDIHEQKLAEGALRESEARFREIADQAPVPMWVTALDRHRAFVNKAYMAFLGVGEDDAKQFDWRTIIHPEDGARLLAESLAGEASLRPFTLEARYRGADGQWVWLRSESNPRFDAEGRLTGFIGAAFDITIAKEAQLRLEDLVLARTAELETTQAALRQSQKLESMGQLTGGVAHDFNNLLTPIVGVLDLLQRRGIGDSRTERLIAGAQQSAERARLLVQRLLAFARRQPLKPVPVDLATLIEGMHELIGSTVGPRVRVETKITPDLPSVLVDPNQLEMAILNLGVNARDAMPDGGVLELVASMPDDADCARLGLAGAFVRLCVSDTGAGMDAETLARAVEPFFSTKGVGQGTGLGLSMVHGLAAQQGGLLDIESTPGQGTVVHLYLPATGDAVAPATQAEATERRGAGLVLLVDDEPLVRAATADMLVDLGYQVVEAESAEAALRVLAEMRVDALVTDHLMPGMSGTDLADRVAAQLPLLPVLIISGFSDVTNPTHVLPRLNKPFRRDDLAAALDDLRIGASEARALD